MAVNSKHVIHGRSTHTNGLSTHVKVFVVTHRYAVNMAIGCNGGSMGRDLDLVILGTVVVAQDGRYFLSGGKITFLLRWRKS